MELINQIRAVPDKIGVYLYLDSSKQILYVGKAKSLKKRLRSYWRFKPSFIPNPNLSSRIIKCY